MVISGEVWSVQHDRVTYAKFQMPHCKFNSLYSSNSMKELRKNSNNLRLSEVQYPSWTLMKFIVIIDLIRAGLAFVVIAQRTTWPHGPIFI